MLSDKASKAMESLGLTDYEMRVYISLLNDGTMTAQELSKKSGVPYSKIYEVVGKLGDKGWLDSDSSRPTKYYPKAPSSALEAMRMRIENQVRENESILIQELTSVYERSGGKEKPEIWVLRGIYNIGAKVKEIIQNCEKELLLALPAVTESVTKPLQPTLRALHEKGIKITILASESATIDSVKALYRIGEVRLKNSMFGGGVISDGRQVIMLLSAEKSGTNDYKALAIWAEHTGLANFAKEYFEYLWKDAKAVGYQYGGHQAADQRDSN
ncbi:MAG: helix-turn-helix domain-containing protein [Nitrososphaerales archaeon]